MARGAPRIVGRIFLLQFYVGIMTGCTREAGIIGVVTAAVKETIGLKTHVVDAAQVGHHCDRVDSAVAGPTEFLRQCLGAKLSWVEDVEVLASAGLHSCDVFCSRTMARFATHTRYQIFEAKLVAHRRSCAVAAETVSRFVPADVAAGSFPEAGRGVLDISNRPVQAVYRFVVADATFVQFSIVAKNVGLRDVCVPKGVQDRFADAFLAVGYTVQDLSAVACDLVSIRTRLKSHPGMGAKHTAFGCNV
jgi:hypothetical protein